VPEPLANRIVWLTREPHANEAWRPTFEAAGATVCSVPCLAVRPRQLPALAARLAQADWLLLTSPAAVRALAAQAPEWILPPSLQLAVVGPATRAAATAQGWPVALEADQADGAGLVAALASRVALRGVRLLWPRSALADPASVAALQAAGAAVDAPTLYDNVAPADLAARAAAAAAAGEPDWIVLASGSAFRHLRAAWPDPSFWRRVKLAAIGRLTAGAVAESGLRTTATAEAPTPQAVVAAIRSAEEA
jgi:uroporphyrinogen III methyltransferase/synthase